MRPGRRRVVVARDDGGGWHVQAPRPWDDAEHMALLRDPADARVVAGLDVPLGVPRPWAHAAGVTAFRQVLAGMRDGRWPRFADPAPTAADIATGRPFYPRAPGGTSRADLVTGLGLAGPDDLLRACDRAIPGRAPAAAPLFWLVGAQQVGRAALSAWDEVVAPVLAHDHVRMWPMDGRLPALACPGRVVLAECYPRAAYEWPLGLPRTGWSKRRQDDRRARAQQALDWAAQHLPSVHPSPALREAVEDGFGAAPDGEDGFDALVGALQMVAVMDGLLPDMPDGIDPAHLSVEGWILGRPAG